MKVFCLFVSVTNLPLIISIYNLCGNHKCHMHYISTNIHLAKFQRFKDSVLKMMINVRVGLCLMKY